MALIWYGVCMCVCPLSECHVKDQVKECGAKGGLAATSLRACPTPWQEEEEAEDVLVMPLSKDMKYNQFGLQGPRPSSLVGHSLSLFGFILHRSLVC